MQVGSRRWFLQTGLAGLAGLSLADTLRLQATAGGTTAHSREPRAVILFWLSGGPSHSGRCGRCGGSGGEGGGSKKLMPR